MTAAKKVGKVFNMKRKTKVLLGLCIFLLLIVAVLALVYFVAFERFVLVSDPAWSYLLPLSELSSMRFALAKRGYRLVVFDASASQLDGASSFTPMLLSLKGSVVLLGPLASASAIRFEVDVSTLLEQAVVYGMWSQACYNFDVTLVSDVNAGWRKAAGQMMAQNVAVVYDSDGSSSFEAIESVISKTSMLEYYDDGSNRWFAKKTVDSMNEKQVVVAFCPHLEGLYNLVALDDSIFWIVDYRYAQMIPKKQLFGIVLPDLKALARDTSWRAGFGKKVFGEDSEVVSLLYKYESR